MDQGLLVRELRLHHIQAALQIASDILFCQAIALVMYLDSIFSPSPFAQDSGMEAVLMFGPECSTDEAVRDTMNDVPPVCERHIVKHHYFGESDYPYVSRLLPP